MKKYFVFVAASLGLSFAAFAGFPTQLCPSSENCNDCNCYQDDPVVITTGTTYFDRVDISIDGLFELRRGFNSGIGALNGSDGTLSAPYTVGYEPSGQPKRQIPRPFGHIDDDRIAGDHKWWHSLHTYLVQIHGGYNHGWRDPMGRWRGYYLETTSTNGNWGRGYNPTGVYPNLIPKDFRGMKETLRWTGTANGSKREVVREDGTVWVYDRRWRTSTNAGNHYFLSRVRNAFGVEVLTIAYKKPTGTSLSNFCNTYNADSDVDVPYIETVTAPLAGKKYKFSYAERERLAAPGRYDCVLEYVDAVDFTSGTDKRVVTYEYLDGKAGLLSGVKYGNPSSPNRAETYSYASAGEDHFAAYTDGTRTTYHKYQLISGGGPQTHVGATSGGGSAVSLSISNIGSTDNGNPGCPTGASCCGQRWVTRTTQDAISRSGSGLDAGTILKREYAVVKGTPIFHGGRVVQITESCNASGGNPNACSPGTITYNWDCSGYSPGPSGTQDKRGSWTTKTYVNETSLGFTKPPIETRVETVGATDSAGTDALEAVGHSYQYGDAGLPVGSGGAILWGHQLPYEDIYPADAGVGQGLVTRHIYDLGRSQLKAVIKYGVLGDLSGGAPKYIGTFYRTTRTCEGTDSDPHGRVLEEEGPCEVSGFGATACNSTGPLKTFYYHSGTGTNDDGKLAETREYPAGCSTTNRLVTTYSGYDVYGNVGQVVAPNGTQTNHTYVDGLLSQKTVSASSPTYSRTTQFTYDHGKLTSVKYPENNYEVFCYRASTASGGCSSSNALTEQLQWRAKASNADGSNWSERVNYKYYSNGLLESEEYVVPSGGGGVEVRRKVTYDYDTHKRPTFERHGDGASSTTSFKTVRAYDRSNNLAAIGPAFVSPPAFCDGMTAVSPPGYDSPGTRLCTWLGYDRANRIQSVVERPVFGDPSKDIETCFRHDGRGNIVRTESGLASALDCTNLATSSTAADYEYDDFGNVVTAKLPNTSDGSSGRGTQKFEYDARGNVIKRQSPEQAAVSKWTEFSYDSLDRLLQEKLSSSSGPAYTLAYDSVPSGDFDDCGETQSALKAVGRLIKRTDSFGETYYKYDAEGRVLKELRKGASPNFSDCDTAPMGHTEYQYSDNGNLTRIVYPGGGRVVDYVYYGINDNGGGANDRIRKISVVAYPNGGSSTTYDVIDLAKWEPYGRLRAYQFNAPNYGGSPLPGAVEVLAGDNSTNSNLDCTTTRSTNDTSGRRRAIWVSTGALADPPTNTGDILKQTYTWTGDQLTRQDTCLLSETVPRRENYSVYDNALRLVEVSRPANNFANTGGVVGYRQYDYDARGKRIGDAVDSTTSATHAWVGGAQPDQLSQILRPNGVRYDFTYDRDGRVSASTTAPDSSTVWSWGRDFYYGQDDHGATPAVFGAARSGPGQNYVYYNYYYDAFGRRRSKVYPVGTEDEFFYDSGKQLLTTYGYPQLTTSTSDRSLDEYVWLDGQAVVQIRSKIVSGQRHDLTGDCPHNGEAAKCGIYFIVNDHIGKPILVIDSKRKVAGYADYDPFGQPNRVARMEATPNPYPPSQSYVLATFDQAFNPSGEHADQQLFVRGMLHLVDTEGCTSTGAIDYAELADGTGTALTGFSKFFGYHTGRMMTPWVDVGSVSGNVVKLNFQSNASNSDLDAPTGCPTTGGTAWEYAGVVVEGYEYRRFQTGADWFWPDFRLPGQYYDAEIDLNENWHRYYDPGIGRYLQPEPVLQNPAWAQRYAELGHSLPAYAYALNNPVHYVDPDGNWPDPDSKGCKLFPWFPGCRREPDPAPAPSVPPGPAPGGPDDNVCKMPRKGDKPYRCATKCQTILPSSGAQYVVGGSTKSCSEATKNAKALAFAVGGTSVHHCRCADTKGFIGTGSQCE